MANSITFPKADIDNYLSVQKIDRQAKALTQAEKISKFALKTLIVFGTGIALAFIMMSSAASIVLIPGAPTVSHILFMTGTTFILTSFATPLIQKVDAYFANRAKARFIEANTHPPFERIGQQRSSPPLQVSNSL